MVTGASDFNFTTMVLLTAVVIILLCVALYIYNHGKEGIGPAASMVQLGNMLLKNKHLLKLYAIPAFLYVLYDNLTFVNLASFDPGTYGPALFFSM